MYATSETPPRDDQPLMFNQRTFDINDVNPLGCKKKRIVSAVNSNSQMDKYFINQDQYLRNSNNGPIIYKPDHLTKSTSEKRVEFGKRKTRDIIGYNEYDMRNNLQFKTINTGLSNKYATFCN